MRSTLFSFEQNKHLKIVEVFLVKNPASDDWIDLKLLSTPANVGFLIMDINNTICFRSKDRHIIINNHRLSCLFESDYWIRRATLKEQQLMIDHSSELRPLLEDVILLHKHGYDYHVITAEEQIKIIAKLKIKREDQPPDLDYYPIHLDFK